MEKETKEPNVKSPDEVTIDEKVSMEETIPTLQPLENLPAEPKPKKRVGLAIMLVVLVLLLVGGALALGYLWGKDNNQPQNSNNTNNSSASEEQGTSSTQEETIDYTEKLIDEEDEVKNVVSKIYDVVKEAVKPSGLVYKVYDGNSVLYKDASMKVATSLDKSYGVAFPGRSDVDVRLGDTVKSAIESLGFVHYDDVVSLSSEGYYINNEKQIICNGIVNTTPFEVDCGKTNWISADKKTFIDNLAEAMGDSNPGIIVADETSIVDSSVSPYQTLTASVSNAAGLFYRNNPNSEWKFFAGTQMIIPCEKYSGDPDTENIKKAFADQTCLADDNKTIVKISEL